MARHKATGRAMAMGLEAAGHGVTDRLTATGLSAMGCPEATVLPAATGGRQNPVFLPASGRRLIPVVLEATGSRRSVTALAIGMVPPGATDRRRFMALLRVTCQVRTTSCPLALVRRRVMARQLETARRLVTARRLSYGSPPGYGPPAGYGQPRHGPPKGYGAAGGYEPSGGRGTAAGYPAGDAAGLASGYGPAGGYADNPGYGQAGGRPPGDGYRPDGRPPQVVNTRRQRPGQGSAAGPGAAPIGGSGYGPPEGYAGRGDPGQQPHPASGRPGGYGYRSGGQAGGYGPGDGYPVPAESGSRERYRGGSGGEPSGGDARPGFRNRPDAYSAGSGFDRPQGHQAPDVGYQGAGYGPPDGNRSGPGYGQPPQQSGRKPGYGRADGYGPAGGYGPADGDGPAGGYGPPDAYGAQGRYGAGAEPMPPDVRARYQQRDRGWHRDDVRGGDAEQPLDGRVLPDTRRAAGQYPRGTAAGAPMMPGAPRDRDRPGSHADQWREPGAEPGGYLRHPGQNPGRTGTPGPAGDVPDYRSRGLPARGFGPADADPGDYGQYHDRPSDRGQSGRDGQGGGYRDGRPGGPPNRDRSDAPGQVRGGQADRPGSAGPARKPASGPLAALPPGPSAGPSRTPSEPAAGSAQAESSGRAGNEPKAGNAPQPALQPDPAKASAATAASASAAAAAPAVTPAFGGSAAAEPESTSLTGLVRPPSGGGRQSAAAQLATPQPATLLPSAPLPSAPQPAALPESAAGAAGDYGIAGPDDETAPMAVIPWDERACEPRLGGLARGADGRGAVAAVGALNAGRGRRLADTRPVRAGQRGSPCWRRGTRGPGDVPGGAGEHVVAIDGQDGSDQGSVPDGRGHRRGRTGQAFSAGQRTSAATDQGVLRPGPGRPGRRNRSRLARLRQTDMARRLSAALHRQSAGNRRFRHFLAARATRPRQRRDPRPGSRPRRAGSAGRG